jgi:Glycosyl transferase family 2
MSQPLVTIITPTYSRPAMFSECAAAVLAQSFTDWTWWVVFNTSVFNYNYPFYVFKEDSRIVPLWYPVIDELRGERYMPARIINWLYPKVTTPYIYFLADDDLIAPMGLEMLTWEASRDNSDAVYGCCEVIDQQLDGSYKHGAWCYPGAEGLYIGPDPARCWDVGLGTGIDPNCRLDGGQVLHTKALWDRATICDACSGTGSISKVVGQTSPPLTTAYQLYNTTTVTDPCQACGATGKSWQLTDRNADAAACDGILLARLAEFARFHYVPQRIVTHRRHAGAAHHRPQVT